MGTFEITLRKDGQYHFTLKASNGEVILSSEMYTTKDGCINGIESVKKNSADPAMYQILEAKDGKPYFTLIAGNNKVIGTSETYQNISNMNKGIAAVQKYGADAKIVDMTV